MMLKLLVLVVALAALATALPAKKSPINQDLVDYVNSQGQWKAKLHPRFADMDIKQLRKLMGARPRSENPRAKLYKPQPNSELSNDDIPVSFDARDKWPKCKDVISNIADQSSCGSCWAVSSASVMSDRTCIGSDGADKTPISSNDIMACCSQCGEGCQGGWPIEAFQWYKRSGVVSGSSFKLDTGCEPYPFAECEHHTNKTKYSPCPKDIYKTPRCTKKCQSSFKTNTYTKDKYHGKSVVEFENNVKGTQREIMTNGPVVFVFDVYSDFVVYDTGVYEHTTGTYLGGHAVRAIGWGTENGKPYWLIANSWNEDWAGIGGYFKIVRGKNNCGIESGVVAAQADSARKPSQH